MIATMKEKDIIKSKISCKEAKSDERKRKQCMETSIQGYKRDWDKSKKRNIIKCMENAFARKGKQKKMKGEQQQDLDVRMKEEKIDAGSRLMIDVECVRQKAKRQCI